MLLWRGKANWARFLTLLGSSLRDGSASLLLWPTATTSQNLRLNTSRKGTSLEYEDGFPPDCLLSSKTLYQCSCARTTRAQMRQPNPRPESRENHRDGDQGLLLTARKTIAGKPASRSSAGVSQGRRDASLIQGNSVPRPRLRSTAGNYATHGAKASGTAALPSKGRIACDRTAATPANGSYVG